MIGRAAGYAWATFRRLLLGRHPYNTLFNFNWVNVRPLVGALRELGRDAGGVVVDLGAGSSPYYDLFGPRAAAYVAVDLPAALPGRDRRPIRRVAGTAEAVPLASGSADLVLCTQVVYQLPCPGRALDEIARVLRPGGRAIVSVPHVSPIHSEPYDLYRFTPDGLRRVAEAAGLRPACVHAQGGLFAGFALCLAMTLVLTPARAGEPMRLRPWRQVLFAPLVGLVNAAAVGLDRLWPTTRTPVNLVLVAEKP